MGQPAPFCLMTIITRRLHARRPCSTSTLAIIGSSAETINNYGEEAGVTDVARLISHEANDQRTRANRTTAPQSISIRSIIAVHFSVMKDTIPLRVLPG
ncbi:hypothetical protein EDB92DRAFT_1888115 [Lactarius akahatsu]|uniref:Uncharacterized protein n=1 Tax=Lactarius akahatsu TaxID=416441 RepID=A0AAD4Q9X1_9AGAM|nr:hypothetical protein EDB92DRAFT_1888115 [Lactarius akahatsu]